MSAYNEGQGAYWNCKALSENPYPISSIERAEWSHGFYDAQEEDQESDFYDDELDDDWNDDGFDDDDETTIYY